MHDPDSADGETWGTFRRTVAEVDLGALAHNLRTIVHRVGRARVLAVVKADAYGHGAVRASEALVAAGAWGLGVSLVEEGVQLRAAGLDAPIVVLGGMSPHSEDVLLKHMLRPVVWTAAQLERLRAAVRRRGGAEPARVHLKIDTGMTRLGVLPQDLHGVLDWLSQDAGRSVAVEGVMTHLACADDLDDAATSQRQLHRFAEGVRRLAQRGLTPLVRHACNSAALARFDAAHFDMVRPGIALYGSAATEAVQLEGLRSTMAVRSQVLAMREVPAGVRVSYGGRCQLDRPSRLAIVPIGYADGYARNMSGRAEMLVRGQRARVVGNITMDTTMLDVTDIADVRAGEDVTLLGTQRGERDETRGSIGLHEMARWAGTLSYEVLCGIAPRVPRRYL